MTGPGKGAHLDRERAGLGRDPGELRRFEELFERYAPRVMGYFVNRGVERSASEELTQEVMLTVWAKASYYDPDRAPLSTWVFTIARNKYVDDYRKRRRPEPDPNDPSFAYAPTSAASSPESEAGIEQRTRALSQALKRLSSDQRDTLRSLYYEGLTMAELSAARGVPLGTIKSRTRRALHALRKELGEPPP